MKILVAVALFLCTAFTGANPWLMPQEQFTRFKNRRGPKGEGSCVYASNSMAGAHHGVPGAEFFLEPWNGHPACMDGSWPDRFVRDCQERGLDFYSVEGPESIEWIRWQLQRGGYAGITYGVGHMITAVGYDAQGDTFQIVDNNFPAEVRSVSGETFTHQHRLHGGGWTTIPKTTGPPPWERPVMR